MKEEKASLYSMQQEKKMVCVYAKFSEWKKLEK